jgi:hypothetical protein
MFKCFFDVLLLYMETFFSVFIFAGGEETKLFVVAFAKMPRDQMRKMDYFFANIQNLARALKFPIFIFSWIVAEREQILIIIKKGGAIRKI